MSDKYQEKDQSKFLKNLSRTRTNKAIRHLFSDVVLEKKDLIYPLFVYEDLLQPEDLSALFGQKKQTQSSILKEIESCLEMGISSFLLFIVPSKKSEQHFDYQFDEKIFKSIKNAFGDNIILFADVCLCSQTSHGHCGLLDESRKKIDNHQSVLELTKKALLYAESGVDVISPSDMMDNRISSIRESLDKHHFDDTLIMSYSTKFASNFYGPFRNVAQSTPSFGDRKSYQIDYRHQKDAINASLRDKQQKADILMVKPALSYLDIIYRLKTNKELENTPIAAYQVSGEYQGLKVMADAGLIDFHEGLLETLYSIKRAKADFIITYAAKELSAKGML